MVTTSTPQSNMLYVTSPVTVTAPCGVGRVTRLRGCRSASIGVQRPSAPLHWYEPRQLVVISAPYTFTYRREADVDDAQKGAMLAAFWEIPQMPANASKVAHMPVDTCSDVEAPQIAPQTPLRATGAQTLNASDSPSWAGWYVIRFWTPDAARVKHEKDIPFFGGNRGGSQDIFGPFASEADAAECALVMGVAERAARTPLSSSFSALPDAAHTLPLPTPIVALLPAPPSALTVIKPQPTLEKVA